jgi:hypothetical protein
MKSCYSDPAWDDRMPQEPWHLDPPPDGSAEDQKERDWAYMEGEARQFIRTYGTAALLRCVSDAVKAEEKRSA